MDRKEGVIRFLIFLLIIITDVTLLGCDKLPLPLGLKKSGEKKATAKPPPPPSTTPPSSIPSPSPSPQKDGEDNYVYDPTDKRDPFQPFIAMQTPVIPISEEIPLTPLQKYDISQLKLVAILVGKMGETAMVEDSEGKGYVVKEGTYIGRNYGKVKSILKDRVIIEEKYKDYLGNVKSKEIVLRIYPIGEEEKP